MNEIMGYVNFAVTVVTMFTILWVDVIALLDGSLIMVFCSALLTTLFVVHLSIRTRSLQ